MSKQEKEICFNYAREMIEDRIESGLPEIEEAVAQLESPQQMAKAFLEDRRSLKIKFWPLPSSRALTILLLILGFPLWERCCWRD